VDRTADLDKAAQEIVKSWQAFNGESRYTPSYILVNEFVQGKFFELIRKYATGEPLSQLGRDSISDRAASAGDISGDVMETVLENPRIQLIKIADRCVEAILDRCRHAASTDHVFPF
jgi:acyl-CoA reductase-like NAD-dependent aldehyde dehydrogenase